MVVTSGACEKITLNIVILLLLHLDWCLKEVEFYQLNEFLRNFSYCSKFIRCS